MNVEAVLDGPWSRKSEREVIGNERRGALHNSKGPSKGMSEAKQFVKSSWRVRWDGGPGPYRVVGDAVGNQTKKPLCLRCGRDPAL